MTATIKALEKRLDQAGANRAKIDDKIRFVTERLTAAEAARHPLLLDAALDDENAVKRLGGVTRERDEAAALLADLQAAQTDAAGLVTIAENALRDGKLASVIAKLAALGDQRATGWENIARLRAEILQHFAKIQAAGEEIQQLAHDLPEVAPRGLSRREIAEFPRSDFQNLVALLNSDWPRELAAGWHQLGHFLQSMVTTDPGAKSERGFWTRATRDTSNRAA